MNETLFFAAIILLKTLLFYFLPTLNGKNTLFGFPVGEDETYAEASRILKNYRFGLLGIALTVLLGIFAVSYYSPKSLIFAYILSDFAPLIWLYANFRKSWKLRKIEVFSKFAASMKPRRFADYTNIFWEIAVVLLTVLPIGFLIYFYPQLPESVPAHWNLDGEVDRWAKKSLASVFMANFIGVFLQIFFVFIKEDIVKAKLRVPVEFAEKIMPLKESSLAANIGLVDWCRLIIGIMFADIAFSILQVLENDVSPKFGNTLLWTGIILLFSGLAYYAYQTVLINRQIRKISGQIVFQNSTEAQSWKDGIFYNNADDAAFFVEKPDGLGYTLNFAGKRAYLYFVMIGIFILLPVFTAIFID